MTWSILLPMNDAKYTITYIPPGGGIPPTPNTTIVSSIAQVKSHVRVGMRTPWGKADHIRVYAEGIAFVGTPGHGGIKLDRKRQAAMPAALRIGGGWYEEDVAYVRVVLAFPGVLEMTDASARTALKDWNPDVYSAWSGEAVTLEESLVLREREFKRVHANDFVVTAAWGSWHKSVPAGSVGVVATRGGVRVAGEERWFLVPFDEYDTRMSFGFVIDLNRHPEVAKFA